MAQTKYEPATPPEGTHAAAAQVFQFFTFAHLPPHLQKISKPFHDLAYLLCQSCGGPELTVSLRKLLESKDAAVRSALKN